MVWATAADNITLYIQIVKLIQLKFENIFEVIENTD